MRQSQLQLRVGRPPAFPLLFCSTMIGWAGVRRADYNRQLASALRDRNAPFRVIAFDWSRLIPITKTSLFTLHAIAINAVLLMGLWLTLEISTEPLSLTCGIVYQTGYTFSLKEKVSQAGSAGREAVLGQWKGYCLWEKQKKGLCLPYWWVEDRLVKRALNGIIQGASLLLLSSIRHALYNLYTCQTEWLEHPWNYTVQARKFQSSKIFTFCGKVNSNVAVTDFEAFSFFDCDLRKLCLRCFGATFSTVKLHKERIWRAAKRVENESSAVYSRRNILDSVKRQDRPPRRRRKNPETLKAKSRATQLEGSYEYLISFFLAHSPNPSNIFILFGIFNRLCGISYFFTVHDVFFGRRSIAGDLIVMTLVNDYAIIQAEDIVRAEEQVFSMLEVRKKLPPILVLPTGPQEPYDAAKTFSRFPLKIFSWNREWLHK